MWCLGSKLKPEAQKEALAMFVHRYTGEHKPKWAYGTSYVMQFRDDNDWLAHTKFQVTIAGNLSKQSEYCISTPTWPNNPELRKEKREAV